MLHGAVRPLREHGGREHGGTGRVVGAPGAGPDQSLRHPFLARVAEPGGPLGVGVGEVEPVQVDPVGAEAAQRGGQGPVEVLRRVVAAGEGAGVRVEGVAPLGGDDDLVPAAAEGPAEDAFAVPGASPKLSASFEQGGTPSSAVSKKVTPRPRARRTTRTDSSSSTLPQPSGCPAESCHSPPIAQQPNPTAPTSIPLRPSVRVLSVAGDARTSSAREGEPPHERGEDQA